MVETQRARASRTPWHVWVIGGIGVLWSAMGVISFVLTQMKVEAVMSRFPPPQRAYFESFPWWIVALWAVNVFGGLIGSIGLLLGNRRAVPALAASAIGSLAYNAGGLFLLGGMQVMRETDGVGLTVVPVVFAVLLASYAYAMRETGVLTSPTRGA